MTILRLNAVIKHASKLTIPNSTDEMLCTVDLFSQGIIGFVNVSFVSLEYCFEVPSYKNHMFSEPNQAPFTSFVSYAAKNTRMI